MKSHFHAMFWCLVIILSLSAVYVFWPGVFGFAQGAGIYWSYYIGKTEPKG